MDIAERIRKICSGHPEYDLAVFSNEISQWKKLGVRVFGDLCEECLRIKDLGARGNKNSIHSHILYYLGITTQKPSGEMSLIGYKSARATMPDFDMDFPDKDRGKMINYVIKKYGEDSVAQIVSFNKMKARAAIRDTGRAYGFDLDLTDQVAKAVPNMPGKPVTIENSLDTQSPYHSPSLLRLYNSNVDAKMIIDTAKGVENTIRGTGIHAAAVIIAPADIRHHTPVMRPGKTAVTKAVTQLDYPTLESLGLLKIDFLGLATLTIITEACRLINERHNLNLTPEIVPFDDEDALAFLGTGNLYGVFQSESDGLRQVFRDMKPQTFDDVAAAISLYRPGPLEHIPAYIARMHGEEQAEYAHPLMEPILSNTQAIIVYQEQIIQILVALAGYTPGEADYVRKGIGKKKIDIIEKHRSIFVNGAVKNGIAESIAEQIYDDLEKFALYGFNRCVSGDDRFFGSDITIEEMYTIKHDKKFAKEHGYLALRDEYIRNGYGRALSVVDMSPGGRLRINKIVDIRYAGVKPLIKIVTSDGRKINVTGNHKFPTTNGYKPAEELSLSDQLYVLREDGIGLANIISISATGNTRKVYDVEMEAPCHNFVTGDGIVTCNSHATSYARITLQTAWLKAHYPLEFLTACLIVEGGDPTKATKYITDCRRFNIDVYGPDIRGQKPYSILSSTKILCGIESIKHVNADTLPPYELRQDIDSLSSFIVAMAQGSLNSRALESMIMVGALDFLGYTRFDLMNNVEVIMASIKSAREKWNLGFAEIHPLCILDLTGREFTKREILQAEKDLTGVYLSGHPVEEYYRYAESLGLNCVIDESIDEDTEVPEQVLLLAVIDEIRTMKTKRNDEMAMLSVSDPYGHETITVFPRQWELVRDRLSVDTVMLVIGKYNFYKGKRSIVADNIILNANISAFEGQQKDVTISVVLDPPQSKAFLRAIKTARDNIADNRRNTYLYLYTEDNAESYQVIDIGGHVPLMIIERIASNYGAKII